MTNHIVDHHACTEGLNCHADPTRCSGTERATGVPHSGHAPSAPTDSIGYPHRSHSIPSGALANQVSSIARTHIVNRTPFHADNHPQTTRSRD
jgi:hypothetical protein